MSEVILSEKKYNFKIGYIFKDGNQFYQIIGIEPLDHYEEVSSVAATSSADQSFSNELKPSEGYAYWIEKVGIDGALGFQLKFPSVPRWTVHGNKRFLYRHRAGYMNMIYRPFLVINPDYPRFTFHNPEASAMEAVIYFEGERWALRSIKSGDVGKYWTDLTSYTDKSIGEG